MLSREDRNAIEGLFERLAEAERRGGPRDAEAEALINDLMRRQPAAAYYLAQTVVVQKEALNVAERRLEELEGRNRPAPQRGPWDRPSAAGSDRPGFGGGGFLAGAAQTALGVAGGVMLGSLIGSIFAPDTAQAADNNDAPADGGDTDAGDSGFDDPGGFDGGFDMGGDF